MTAVAFAVRLAWVLAVPTHPVGDFAMYWESAAYLVEHGALDPQFIYMPGYVAALAVVQALGGGLLAGKLLGVAAGALATAAVTGLAARLFDRASAVAAGLLCALWPAGVVVSSVTGTDMPAAALLVTAAWLLVRDAHERPWRAAVLFGLVMGLAAYVRAVALPLVLFAAPIWWAVGAPWRRIAACTALSCALAFLTLLPWGLRNHAVYGELFLTDSHGGHTALVGANPNTDGVYSRSLNRMFTETTGYRLLEAPHREADRAAYALAKRWTAFEPDYALGLLAAKADRLLTHERPLLYWPIYREGVLEGSARDSFARHRVEPSSPGRLLLVRARRGRPRRARRRGVAAALAGPRAPAAAARARGDLRRLLRRGPLPPRGRRLPLPLRGPRLALALAGRARPRGPAAQRARSAAGAARGRAGVAACSWRSSSGWPRLVAAGAELRDRHRWGVGVCHVEEQARLCAWRPTIPAPGEGRSGVRGVWDGIGLKLSTAIAAAATDVDVPPGKYRVSLLAACAAAGPAPGGDSRWGRAARPQGRHAPRAPGGASCASRASSSTSGVSSTSRSRPTPLDDAHSDDLPAVWISDLKIEADFH